MMKILKFIFASILITQSWSVNASWFGPDNYEDCILEGIPTAKTDLAVRTVMSVCRNKFPAENLSTSFLKDRTPYDRSGTYACEGVQGNRLLRVEVNEDDGLISLDGHEAAIAQKTQTKIYSEKDDGKDVSDVYAIFETPFALIYSDQNTTLEVRFRSKSSGQEGSNKYRCEKST